MPFTNLKGVNQIFILITFAVVLSTLSCKESVSKPDTSSITADVKFIRFEEELFSIDTNNIEKALASLKVKYPVFTNLYFSNILPLTQDSTKLTFAIKKFISDKDMIKLKDTSCMVLGNFKELESEITEAIKNIKFYIPQYREPRFYTFISEYGYQNFIFRDGDKDGIGIGLDMFLNGFDYKKLDPQNPNFSDYLTRTFNREHLVPKTMQTIINDIIAEPEQGRLLDYMIANGKKLYLKKLVLPEYNDTLIFEHNAAQMQWLEDNELEIWTFFIDQNLMYETGFSKIGKYVSDSPNAPGMPQQAPGKTANYIGYKIIEAYINKYPKMDIMTLINNNNVEEILKQSKYKPKRK
jgi:hypothetical protein